MASLDDELLLMAGKGRSSKKGKRARSESEEDDWEDEEEYVDSEEEKKPAKKRAAARGRGKQAADEDDDDDDDGGSGSDDESDIEDKLAGMTELERELFLFERDEQRARERDKKQALQQARKSKEKSVEVRASSRRARPATGADSAIGKLAAARQQREKRAARRKEEDEEEEEKEEEEDEEEEEGAAEPSSDEREGGPGEGGAGRAFGAKGAADYDDGEGEGDEEEDDPADLVAVHKMQLKRDMLEQWHNKPFFDDAVKGCVVRIVFGSFVDHNGVKQPNYLMMRVVEAVEKQPYRFTLVEGVKTSKYLVLEDQGLTKAMPMAQISTKDITQEEFDRWNRHCEKGGARKILKRDANLAAAQIQAALNYKFTKEDIQRKLAAKREKGQVVGGLVTEKERLRGLLEAAEIAGDVEEAAQLKAKLDELEAHHAALKRAAAEARAGMAGINARNRNINFAKALNNVGNRPDGDAGGEGGTDVFSRRQTQSKVYWQTGKKGEKDDGGAAGAAAAAPATPEKQQQAGGGGGGAATRRLSRTMSKMDPEELLNVLSIDVDLSRLPRAGTDAAAAAAARRMLGGGRWQLSDAGQRLAAGGGGREILLSEYMQRMAAANQGAA